MTLVLDTIAYAERDLLEDNPALAAAVVKVHLLSDMTSLNKVIAWGYLGDRSSWKKAKKSSNPVEDIVENMRGSIFKWVVTDKKEEKEMSAVDDCTPDGDDMSNDGEKDGAVLGSNSSSINGFSSGGRNRWTIAAAAVSPPPLPPPPGSPPASSPVPPASARLPSTASVGRRTRSGDL